MCWIAPLPGVRFEGVDGEDDAWGEEGASVLPKEGPGEGGTQISWELVEADAEGLQDGAGEDGGVAEGDVEEAAVVARAF